MQNPVGLKFCNECAAPFKKTMREVRRPSITLPLRNYVKSARLRVISLTLIGRSRKKTADTAARGAAWPVVP